VHVALWEGGTLAAGAVALPAMGEVRSTRDPMSGPCDGSCLRVVVSRTRPPEVAQRVADALGAELQPLGSAGAKAMAVVRGDADAYLHAGGQYEWDLAAPAAVAQACGLHVSRIDGTPLAFNKPDPWLPDVLVCRSELAASMLDAIDAAA
jgi:3'(2'), 5'-bisphosphate nucleotidase